MRKLSFLIPALLVVGTLAAQTAIYSGPVRTFHTSVGKQRIVRDSAGNLYTIYRDQFNHPTSTQNDIAIGRSTDGGKTWKMDWQKGFAFNGASDWGNAGPCIAIDGNDNLHCSWWHQTTSSSSARSIRYNRWDAQTKSWGTELNVTGNGYGRVTQALAVDAKNYVWFIHSRPSGSWYCEMKRSDLPYASDMKFSPTNPVFTAAGTCQKPSIISDFLGRIHVTYYSTANGATVHHQWMDPGATTPVWSTAKPLGNSNAVADYYSVLAADLNGNVYVVYDRDDQGDKTPDPEWFLRKWDGASKTWSSPVSIYKTKRATYDPPGSKNYNDGRVISAACDETTGELYFVYRNFDSGELVLGRWHDGDAVPTTYAKLVNTGTLPPNSRNYLLYPQLRGSLFPTFNRTSIGLDCMYTVGDQNAPTPKYTLYYDPFPVGSLSSTGAPKIGTTYTLDLSAFADKSMAYVAALSVADITPGIGVDRRLIPLVPDTMFFLTVLNVVPSVFVDFQGSLSASTPATAQAKIVIPNLPALVNIKFYAAFITYPGGPMGIKTISNPFTFTITN